MPKILRRPNTPHKRPRHPNPYSFHRFVTNSRVAWFKGVEGAKQLEEGLVPRKKDAQAAPENKL